MSTKTLLEHTQDILSALDSDEVQSISDTVESLQVARIVGRAYDSIASRADLLEHYTIFQLEASGDSNKPTVMTRPSDVDSIEWVQYDIQTLDDDNVNYRTIKFSPLDEFIHRMTMINEDDDNVITFTYNAPDAFTIKVYNDRAPMWYTCYDDLTLVFDSYDADVDTTLQNSKTLCYGKKEQTFTMEDSFVPFMDPEFTTLLSNEAMVLAFAELKQVPHEIAKMWAMRAWTKVQNTKRGVDRGRKPFDDLPNYGRGKR